MTIMRDRYLSKLFLRDYRSYRELYWELDAGLNLIVGKNAAGKTNLLESIHYIASGRSPRTSRDSELVRWGEEGFYLKGRIEGGRVHHTLERAYRPGRGKLVRVDGVAQQRIADGLGFINTVIFSPDDLSLIKGGPDVRRHYFDGEIAQIHHTFERQSTIYQRILSQRNDTLRMLRSRSSSREQMDEMLSPWDAQLVDVGSEIVATRLRMLLPWSRGTADVYQELAGKDEKLTLCYVPSWGDSLQLVTEDHEAEPELQVSAIASAMRDTLIRKREEELQRGYSVAGPHRDDVQLELNGVNVRNFGSQGQQRSAALALKIAEVAWMQQQTHHHPLLLLDDVMSELDVQRSHRLAELLDGAEQTVITCTDLSELNFPSLRGQVWRVSRDEVSQVEQANETSGNPSKPSASEPD